MRGKIINDGVKVELAVNLIITSAFGVNGKSTLSFDKSSSLTFAQKVNLLTDLNIIKTENKTKEKFIKFAEIRNEFAHKFGISKIEFCNKEIQKFLKKEYGENENLMSLYELLYSDVKLNCQEIFDNFLEKADKLLVNEWNLKFSKMLFEKIKDSGDQNFIEKYNMLLNETNEDFEKLDLPVNYGDKILI